MKVNDDFLIINMSGHPLSNYTLDSIKIKYNVNEDNVVNVKIPNVDLEKIDEFATEIINNLYSDYSQQLLTGNYAIIPPGLSPLAILVVTLLHGLTGFFPILQPLKRVDNINFSPTFVTYDLQSLRTKMRDFRQL